MFTTPAPAPPSVSANTISPTSPSARPSRLRGLSYLRNYTHSLHSHSHSAGAAGGNNSRADARAPRDQASQTVKSGHHRARSASSASPTPPILSIPSSSTPNIFAGQSRLSSTHSAPESPGSSTHSEDPSPSPSTMTRTRTETSTPGLTVRNQSGPTPASPPPTVMDNADSNAEGAQGKHHPSIRFIPHQDPRPGRPSLQFPVVTRTLPDESAVIRVGRYSERDNITEVPSSIPSAAAIGFKSKVVSRKHCELWCSNQQWYIKDVKSSSGTFLNHIRLSQPNVESKPFKVKDGDIIQLGIDFRGGEEMIFRCVKIRIECNRGWQQGLNNFNKQTHQRLRNLAKPKPKDSDTASTTTSECSICLMGIAPCQSLFVAPCSHVWHYKCIRPILNGPTWPNFLCPNCRAVTDLEADVEDPGDFEVWDDADVPVNGDNQVPNGHGTPDRHLTPRESSLPMLNPQEAAPGQSNAQYSLADLEAALSAVNVADSLSNIANQPIPNQHVPIRNFSTPQRVVTPPSSSITQPVPVNPSNVAHELGVSPLIRTGSDTLSPDRAPEGPMTPRNDVGPFVLDGSGSRGSGNRREDSSSPSSGSTQTPILPPLNIG